MPTLDIGAIAETTGGRLVRGNPDTSVSSFDIDTRRLGPDSAFFALAGEHTDGHRFTPQAREAGAVLAVVQSTIDAEHSPEAILQVDDVGAALTACGRLARERLAGVRVVALTGSAGKTTTKELIAAALSSVHRTHRTHGNFNNHLGVPLTLLACPEDAEYAVIEMGMNAPGEIASLAELARPDFGLVTNVRPAHMAAFRSLDDVAAAKGELFAVLADEATSVVNLDDPHVHLQSMRHVGPRITFGRDARADLRIESLQDRWIPGAAVVACIQGAGGAGEERIRMQLRLGGGHSAHNAVAALALARAVGIDLDAAAAAIAGVEPGLGRGRVTTLASGATLIDDSYNSNPGALRSVLDTLAATPCQGHKVVVVGDMLELGEREDAFHEEAGKHAAAAGVDVLIGVGPRSRTTVEAARREGVSAVRHETETAAVAGYLAERLREGDLVLVKGSRGVALERVVTALIEGGVRREPA